jgi:hypothetical protein
MIREFFGPFPLFCAFERNLFSWECTMKILKIDGVFAIKKSTKLEGANPEKIFCYVFSDPVTGEKQERLASWNDRKNRI